MDGKIIVGTEIKIDKLKDQIKQVEKEIKDSTQEIEKKTKIKSKLEIDSKKSIDNIKDLERKIKDLQAKASEMQTRIIPEKLVSDTEYQKILSAQNELNQKLKEEGQHHLNIRNEIIQTSQKIEEAKKEISENIDKSKSLNEELAKIKKNADIKDKFNEAGNSLTSVIKKVAKWGLAIFGIRSAYNAVRSAMSTLSQYDETMASNIEYIRYVLANALKPVVEYLINLAYKLLVYTNYILKTWFGIDLFAGATADSFVKAKDGLAGANKEAKKLGKQLANFDEMNVLSDTSDGSKSGASGGTALPNLPTPEDVPIPKWVEFIAKQGKTIISIIAGITGALIALKYTGLDPIQSLGIGLIITGILVAVQGIIDYLKEPTWENFGKIIQGIGLAIIGLGALFLGLPAVIAGVIVLIVGTVIKHWEEIKSFLQNGIDWLFGKSDFIHEKFGDVIGNIYDFFVRTIQNVLDWFDSLFNSIKRIFDGIIEFVKGVFTGDWKRAFEGLKEVIFGVGDAILSTFKMVFNILKDMVFTGIDNISKGVGGIFKGVINAVLSTIEAFMNGPISAINSMIDLVNSIPGVSIPTLNPVQLPRLAKGGIINNPGRGVMVGNAIAGERGMEGVIPLTDSQQMQLLGQSIGRFITINANITNSMNGRIISRELQRIQNDSDFAFNR